MVAPNHTLMQNVPIPTAGAEIDKDRRCEEGGKDWSPF
jgi:hypothetical protein